jgi:hypothetical protein
MDLSNAQFLFLFHQDDPREIPHSLKLQITEYVPPSGELPGELRGELRFVDRQVSPITGQVIHEQIVDRFPMTGKLTSTDTPDRTGIEMDVVYESLVTHFQATVTEKYRGTLEQRPDGSAQAEGRVQRHDTISRQTIEFSFLMVSD